MNKKTDVAKKRFLKEANEVSRKQFLEETAKRLEEGYKLQGKLEIIIEIQDRFYKGWGVIHATGAEWDKFAKPYIEQKV